MTPAELKRIEDAGSWYGEQAKACEERQKQEAARLRADKRPAADVAHRQREVILECRQQVLVEPGELERTGVVSKAM